MRLSLSFLFSEKETLIAKPFRKLEKTTSSDFKIECWDGERMHSLQQAATQIEANPALR
jgi:hypothetical protein